MTLYQIRFLKHLISSDINLLLWPINLFLCYTVAVLWRVKYKTSTFPSGGFKVWVLDRLCYLIKYQKRNEKIRFFFVVCTSHVTGKDNTKDFLHILWRYHGKLNNFEECFYKSTLFNVKYTVQSNQLYLYFLATALSVLLNKYICVPIFISTGGFCRQYDYCTLNKEKILPGAAPGYLWVEKATT